MIVRVVRRTPEARAARVLVVVSLLCWAGAIATGRFLAYTYQYIDATALVEGRPRRP